MQRLQADPATKQRGGNSLVILRTDTVVSCSAPPGTRQSLRRALHAMLLCVLLSPAALRAAGGQQQQSPPSASAPPTGIVIQRILCAALPEQSYALYLPKEYTPARKWPVLFAFDPLGIGKDSVNFAKDAAEHFGFIVAGSNNSRNGPAGPQQAAARAMIEDVLTRFAVDTARVYVTGFSGGARVATSVALGCKTCIAGVFAHGAGFPATSAQDNSPFTQAADIHFSYFSAVGDADFNYPELVELSHALDRLGAANRLRRYSGAHQWAPPEVWQEALAWMEIRGMKEGRSEKNAALIAAQLAASMQRIAAFEKSGDPFAAWEECRKSAELFDGLTDVTAFAARAAELRNSPAVLKAMKDEALEIRRQREWAAKLIPELNSIAVGTLQPFDLLARIRADFAPLREASQSRKFTPEVKAAQRAMRQVQGVAFDSAYAAMNAGNFGLAQTYAELLVELAPERPGPHLMLGRVHAAAGRRKQALGEIKRAVEKGLNDPDALRDTPQFDSLRDDPLYKDLLAKVEHEAAIHPPS